MSALSSCLWSDFWEHGQDVSTLVTKHFHRKDKEGLRAASSSGRTAANSTVSRVEIIKEEDLRWLPDLRLHERFPHVAFIALKDCVHSPVVTSISTFARLTLQKLPKLVSVDLSQCSALTMVSACRALARCSQLEDLSLPQALGALAQLTLLTSLTMALSQGLDFKGLQQLSSLQRRQSWDLAGSSSISDADAACLAHLTALTHLNLASCRPFTGSGLAQLTALSGLLSLSLGGPHLSTVQGLQHMPALQHLELRGVTMHPAKLAALAALTSLTSLDMQYSKITDACSGILRLPNLAKLVAFCITLAAPAAGMCSELTHLKVHEANRTLPHLLKPLQKLRDLYIGDINDDDDDDEYDSHAELVAAVSQLTGLTSLDLEPFDVTLSDLHMQQMVAPLKQLRCLRAGFDSDEISCLTACCAIAELSLLRELTLMYVPEPQHLALLNQCMQLQEFNLFANTAGADTGLLAALVCKRGLCKLTYQSECNTAVDHDMLARLAAQVGVQLDAMPGLS